MTAYETRRWFRDMAPALAVLLMTTMFSLFYGDNAALDCWQTVYRAPLRFLRFAALLSIPLFALPKLYGFITLKKAAVLLQVKQKSVWKIEPIKHWIFRPLQGIGVGLLFGTKLLAILPLVVFAVLHTYFLSSRTGLFSKSYLGKGVILQRDE